MFLVDSNVFLHILLHTPEGEKSKLFLNQYEDTISTTIYNLIEISSVLSRKYNRNKKDIQDIIATLKDSISVSAPDEYDAINAYEIAMEHFLTPIDSLLLAMSKREDLILVTYDKELLKYNDVYCKVATPDSV